MTFVILRDTLKNISFHNLELSSSSSNNLKSEILYHSLDESNKSGNYVFWHLNTKILTKQNMFVLKQILPVCKLYSLLIYNALLILFFKYLCYY